MGMEEERDGNMLELVVTYFRVQDQKKKKFATGKFIIFEI